MRAAIEELEAKLKKLEEEYDNRLKQIGNEIANSHLQWLELQYKENDCENSPPYQKIDGSSALVLPKNLVMPKKKKPLIDEQAIRKSIRLNPTYNYKQEL